MADLAALKAKLAELERIQRQQEYAARLAKASTDVLAFAQATMPDPADPLGTLYELAPHHKLIGAELQRLYNGEINRLAIALPPRAGKSELGARRLIPWWLGRRPTDSIIFATYSEEFAGDFGREVRSIFRDDTYRRIFSGVELEDGSQAADRLMTTAGGRAFFVGRGGALTGRGANLAIVDDLLKDSDEANSPTIRERMWSWFTRVFLTRLMGHDARVLVIGTRWNEDDILGRLTDPTNPHYDAEEAAKWRVLRLPALADEENDPLGRQRGEALWPSRFPVEFLASQRRLDPRGFSALYQGRPAPEEGAFFKAEWIKTYRADELPADLRIYAASDHAVSTRQTADLTCLLPVGVDRDDNIWVLPDVWWRRADAEVVIEAMLSLMARRKPLFWWAEKGHISLAIGPALRRRMRETGTYVAMDEVTPAKDKQTRAQAVQARMALGKVRFPAFAPWWGDAYHQLLTFPLGGHDDFVDALALVGLKLGQQVGPGKSKPAPGAPLEERTLRWVKESSRQAARDERRRAVARAW